MGPTRKRIPASGSPNDSRIHRAVLSDTEHSGRIRRGPGLKLHHFPDVKGPAIPACRSAAGAEEPLLTAKLTLEPEWSRDNLGKPPAEALPVGAGG